MGCDPVVVLPGVDLTLFQSTHPVWGATACSCTLPMGSYRISIHAPRVGCDPMKYGAGKDTGEFQSTHPVWGAT